MKKKNVANMMIIPDTPAASAHLRRRGRIHHDAMINASEKR